MSPSSPTVTTALRVGEMCCAEEAELIEKAIASLQGVESVEFNLLASTVSVRHLPHSPTAQELIRAIESRGFRASPLGGGHQMSDVSDEQAPGAQGLPLWASGALLLGGVALHLFAGGEAARWAYLGAGLIGLPPIALRASRSLRHLRLDMHVLMTVGIGSALLIGEWFDGAALAFLFGLALWLEGFSVGRVRSAIRSLLDLSPQRARVKRNGSVLEVAASEVEEGELVLVHPGEKIPLDGRVEAGSSEVDQSALTGESAPVRKEPGAIVFAATLNGYGALDVRVTRRHEETAFAKMVHLVEKAQATKARVQTRVETFARYYTPSIIALAVAVVALGPLLSGDPWLPWFYRALVLLVISCPCALVLSTPISVVSAIARAAREGILIKGGAFLEALGEVRAVAFDKTGTLTEGRMRVRSLQPVDHLTGERLLALAAALESRSEHHVARAILQEAERRGVRWPEGEDVEASPGRGVLGRVEGKAYALGSPPFIREHIGREDGEVEALSAPLLARGETVILLAGEGRLLGLISLSDTPRRGAAEALEALRREGVIRTVMLTGDHPRAAQAIAAELGVGEFRSGLLPEGKVEAVREMVGRDGAVLMVGDGVNDAAALAAASVGVAMGAAGTDAAVEAADVALMGDELEKLPYLLRLGRRTRRVIGVNIALSVGVKFSFLLLALLGWATLSMAAAADMGVSLLVVANGLTLLRGSVHRTGGAR